MAKYMIRYWFEHGSICLWSANDNARNRFKYPTNPSPWTPWHKHDFKNRANMAYLKLLSELGDEFEIINEIDKCVI